MESAVGTATGGVPSLSALAQAAAPWEPTKLCPTKLRQAQCPPTGMGDTASVATRTRPILQTTATTWNLRT